MSYDHRIAGTAVADIAYIHIFHRQFYNYSPPVNGGMVVAVAINIFHGYIVDIAGDITFAEPITGVKIHHYRIYRKFRLKA